MIKILENKESPEKLSKFLKKLFQNYDSKIWNWEYGDVAVKRGINIVAIDDQDNTYDAIMCVGTFTFGHVKPPALDEFIRITKNKGLICFTINEGIHEEYGFDKKIKELKTQNKWKEDEFFKSNYIAS